MNKKIAYLFFVAIFFYYNSFCQKELKRTACCCSTIINQLSSEWKKDSLANNDFRKLNSKLLLTCKLDTITVSFLIRNFGKPSEIRNTNHGTEYLYYYFDIRTRPKNYDAPSSVGYIAFYFNTDKQIQSIGEGDIDVFR